MSGAVFAILMMVSWIAAFSTWRDGKGVGSTLMYFGLVMLAFRLQRRATPEAAAQDAEKLNKAKSDFSNAKSKRAETVRAAKEHAESRRKIEVERQALKRISKAATPPGGDDDDALDFATFDDPIFHHRENRRTEGGKLDTIQFTYMDHKGDVTERRVVVRVIDEEYFEGRCLTRQDSRTFRLDRVLGHVISENTGEVLDPNEWAEQFR